MKYLFSLPHYPNKCPLCNFIGSWTLLDLAQEFGLVAPDLFSLCDLGGSWVGYGHMTTKCMTVCIVLFHPQASICYIRTHTGPQKSTRASICEQAGCKGFHVSGRDLTAIEPHFNQGPWVAHTGLLCTDRRRVCKIS